MKSWKKNNILDLCSDDAMENVANNLTIYKNNMNLFIRCIPTPN